MTFSTKNLLWISLVALFLGSCLGSSKEEGITRSGKKFINFTNKEGKKPVKGSYVSFHYYIKDNQGKVVSESNPLISKPYQMIGDSTLFVEEALGVCGEGDSISFYLQAKDIYSNVVPPYLKSVEDSIVLILKVKKIQSEEELKQAQINKEKEQLDIDTKKIEKYLKDSSLIAEKTPSGLQYIILKSGEGNSINAGDYVSVHYKGLTLDGKVFNESYKRNEPYSFSIGLGQVLKGWDEGIALFKNGGKGLLFLPSSLAYGDKGAGGVIPPNTPLIFEIEIVKVESAQELQERIQLLMKKRAIEEDGIIQNYLKKNKLKASKTESGLYYVITKEGNGIQPKVGSKVSVHYKGSLLNGEVFDESYQKGQPLDFVLGQGQVISGWDEGISLLKEGSKATFLLPSRMAYGDRQTGNIAPHSILRFDVELVKVSQ
jgi:FKBP-type peptidyl-prolyl cis-trans isomerase